MAGPSSTLMPKKPIAVPRRSGGNTRKITYMENGCSMPATAPCAMRQKISMVSLGLSPASASAHTNTLNAPTKVLRSPKL